MPVKTIAKLPMTMRPLCRRAIRPSIQERQQEQQRDDDARNDHRRDRLERPGKMLQELEQAHEIPLGPRDVRRVGRIGDRVEWRVEGNRERQQQREDGRDRDRVLDRVVGIKRRRRARHAA